MEMVDLKTTKKDREKMYGNPVETLSDDGPKYPYGTRLTLDENQIDKLGIGKLPAGCMVMVEAVGKIIEVNVNESSTSKKRQRMEIQLQKISVEKKPGSDKRRRDEVGKEVYED